MKIDIDSVTITSGRLSFTNEVLTAVILQDDRENSHKEVSEIRAANAEANIPPYHQVRAFINHNDSCFACVIFNTEAYDYYQMKRHKELFGVEARKKFGFPESDTDETPSRHFTVIGFIEDESGALWVDEYLAIDVSREEAYKIAIGAAENVLPPRP